MKDYHKMLNNALRFAAEDSDLNGVIDFHKRGAEINSLDNFNRSALTWAVIKNNESIIKYLLENGAEKSIAIIDKWGRSPKSIALENGQENIINLLEQNSIAQDQEKE